MCGFGGQHKENLWNKTYLESFSAYRLRLRLRQMPRDKMALNMHDKSSSFTSTTNRHRCTWRMRYRTVAIPLKEIRRVSWKIPCENRHAKQHTRWQHLAPLPSKSVKPYYVTSPIFYVNGGMLGARSCFLCIYADCMCSASRRSSLYLDIIRRFKEMARFAWQEIYSLHWYRRAWHESR